MFAQISNASRFSIRIRPPGKFISRKTKRIAHLVISGKNVCTFQEILKDAASPTRGEQLSYAESFMCPRMDKDDDCYSNVKTLANAVVPFGCSIANWNVEVKSEGRGDRAYYLVVDTVSDTDKTRNRSSHLLARASISTWGVAFRSGNELERKKSEVEKKACRSFAKSIRDKTKDCAPSSSDSDVITTKRFTERVVAKLRDVLPDMNIWLEGTRTLEFDWKDRRKDTPSHFRKAFRDFLPGNWIAEVGYTNVGINELGTCLSSAETFLNDIEQTVEEIDEHGYDQYAGSSLTFRSRMSLSRSSNLLKKISMHKESIGDLYKRLEETHGRMTQVIDNAQGVSSGATTHLFE